MEESKRLMGYVKYNNIDFPFEYDNSSFSIYLYPPTQEIWNEYYDPFYQVDFLNNNQDQEHKSSINISGITSSKDSIHLNIRNNLKINNGFLEFYVNWYAIFQDDFDINNIDGYKTYGNEIDLFYPPKTDYKASIKLAEDKSGFSELSFYAVKEESESCGKYIINNEVSLLLEVVSCHKYYPYSWTNPLKSFSCLISTFSNSVGIEIVVKSYQNLREFLQYITYRKNIALNRIYIFSNSKDKEVTCGSITFNNNYIEEISNELKDRVIKYKQLKENTARIFGSINSKQLCLDRLVDSIENINKYNRSRVFMVISEFEGEYSNTIERDTIQTDKYEEINEEIINLLSEYNKNKKGAKRKHVKSIIRIIKKLDNNLQQNVKSALIYTESIMRPFCNYSEEGTYSDIIKNISSRINAIRNLIAHGKLDFKMSLINLKDVEIIEKLIYAIRLKKIGVNEADIKKAINDLFLCNIAFDD